VAPEELVDVGLPAPAVNQLVLSPFNQHKDVVEWINRNNDKSSATQQQTILSCNAWSKLSSAQGPQDGWAIVAEIGKNKGMTKAQVLVRWAFQKGYLCVPRSGSKSKIERIAIQENSYNGVRDFLLTEKEMITLDGLEEKLPAGRLGIIDGWSESDILSETWDPTLAI
jgi:diketogulonate reductase-like aldo/keto reductase